MHMMWIDTHCHLDADEFGALSTEIRAQAAIENVAHCIYPAVQVSNFERVRALAHAHQDSYALGIHPLYVGQSDEADLDRLDAALAIYKDDPRLVAVGEIGLDYFVVQYSQSPLKERQEFFYRAQLKLARKHGLPVILHVRKSADQLLKGVRDIPVSGGIAHAFNGSGQQAAQFIALGFALGFGGALTYARASHVQLLAKSLPLESIVMETDAPDMPPHWLYVTAEQRERGRQQGVNSPAQLPRIAQALAQLRGVPLEVLRDATTHNAQRVLPKLRFCLSDNGTQA